jgi:homoserine dehydrogenase
VEVIGGVTIAKDIVFQAIESNKHVVTANKALLATYLAEIIDLLHKHPTVRFGYEAAVCGGIPIIHTLQTTYLGDRISMVTIFTLPFTGRTDERNSMSSQIKGIMNGTTNFILTKMEKEGADYHEVLQEAQVRCCSLSLPLSLSLSLRLIMATEVGIRRD